jgi:hypothetical protein
MPYIEMMGIDPTEFVGSETAPAQEAVQAMYGGAKMFDGGQPPEGGQAPWAITDIDTKRDRGWGSWLTDENKMGVDNLDAGLTMLSNIGSRWQDKRTGTYGKTVEEMMREGDFTSADMVANAYEPNSSNAGTWGVNAPDVFRPNEMGYPTQFTGYNAGQIGGPAVAKYGGTPKTLQRFDKGGSTKITREDIKLGKGETVRFDPTSQRYIIIDRKGQVKGYLNIPVSEGAGGSGDLNTQTKAVESGKPTKSQNIPKDAVKWDPNKDGYDESQVEAGDYIMKNNRWYLVKGKKVTPYTGTKIEDMDQSLTGKAGDLRETYGRLENKINSSPELQKALIKKYRENIVKAKAKGILKQSDIDAASGLSDEEIVSNYLSSQKQIMIINANKGDIGKADTDDIWDRGVDSKTGLPKSYVAATKELGLTPKSIAETLAFQTAYIGMQDLYDDPAFKDELADFALPKAGLDDEGKGLSENLDISDADGWWGNTTVGQAQVYKPVQKELDMEEVADTELEKDGNKT